MDTGEGGLAQIEKGGQMFETIIESDVKTEIVKEELEEGYFFINSDFKTEHVYQENNRIGYLELKQDDVKLDAENTDSNSTHHSVNQLINEELAQEGDCIDIPKYLTTKVKTEEDNIFYKDVMIKSVKKEQTDNEPSVSSNILIKSENSYENDERLEDLDETQKAEFQCNVCLKSFKRLDSLKCHQRIHTGEKPYTCEICSRRFAFNFNFRKHMTTHTTEKMFPCKICLRSFCHMDALLTHEMRHYCKVCSKFNSSVSYVAKHEKEHRIEKSPRCDKSDIIEHRNNHEGKPYLCKVCLKSFNKIRNLRKHLKIHADKKPFPCKVCSKSFVYNYNLVNHEKRHSVKKAFCCEVCLKSFSHKSSLVRHVKIHFAETPN